MSDVSNPAKYGLVVAPSDVTDLANPTRALYVGSAGGNISVQMYGDNATVILTAVPIGILPLQVRRVNATGTTSTNIVALW
jgi:hypothetical protein